MPSKAPDTVRICHLADFHLPLPGPVRPWHLVNKRALGWLNLRLGRSRTHRPTPFAALIRRMVDEHADLNLIAGDVANLSFDSEYAAIDVQLRDAGLTPDSTLVIPGNHDRYTVLADRNDAFERGMSRWLPDGFARRPSGYPFSRTLGPVEVIALDTAVWRGPIRAAGRIDRPQLDRLTAMLDRTRAAGRWPVIAMHHPPFRLADEPLQHYRTGLEGFERFHEALSGRAATVLHGHLHRLSRVRIGDLEIISPPSASNDCGHDDRQLAFCCHTFGANGLVEAEVIRHWPGAEDDATRFERRPLPPPSHRTAT